jgi:uncharacterized BrkB/YihY/UPF0761 family membrane protein
MSDGSSAVRPHRGTLILVFGILGLVVCGIFGIFAWVMGNADLAAMERGEMDRTGKDTTNIGKILGIISVVLMALLVIFGVLMAVGAVMVGAGAAHR